jgi:hypothetical protein
LIEVLAVLSTEPTHGDPGRAVGDSGEARASAARKSER